MQGAKEGLLRTQIEQIQCELDYKLVQGQLSPEKRDELEKELQRKIERFWCVRTASLRKQVQDAQERFKEDEDDPTLEDDLLRAKESLLKLTPKSRPRTLKFKKKIS